VHLAGVPSVQAIQDHAPFVMALTELALTIRIERLDLAAQLQDLVAVGGHSDVTPECLQKAARHVRDTSMAWDRFCQRLGVPPTVAVATLPGGDRLAHADRLASHLLGSTSPDPTIARALDDGLRTLWRFACDRWQDRPATPTDPVA
jgi:hypothetical protein